MKNIKPITACILTATLIIATKLGFGQINSNNFPLSKKQEDSFNKIIKERKKSNLKSIIIFSKNKNDQLQRIMDINYNEKGQLEDSIHYRNNSISKRTSFHFDRSNKLIEKAKFDKTGIIEQYEFYYDKDLIKEGLVLDKNAEDVLETMTVKYDDSPIINIEIMDSDQVIIGNQMIKLSADKSHSLEEYILNSSMDTLSSMKKEYKSGLLSNVSIKRGEEVLKTVYNYNKSGQLLSKKTYSNNSFVSEEVYDYYPNTSKIKHVIIKSKEGKLTLSYYYQYYS